MAQPALRKHLWHIGAILAGFFIFWLVFSAVRKEDLLREIEDFGFLRTAAFLAVGVFVFLLNSVRWQIILRHSGFKPKLKYLFKLKLMTYPVSFLTPTAYFGSEPLRVRYLCQDHNISAAAGWSSALIEGFFELFVKGVLVALVILYIISEFIFSRRLELILLISASLWLGFLFLLLYRLIAKRQFLGVILKNLERIEGLGQNSLLQNFKEIDDNFLSFFNLKNGLLWKGLAVSLAVVFLQLFELYVLLALAGLTFPLSVLMLLRVLMFAAELTPIPMFLGSAEFLQILFFSLYSLPSHLAIFIPLMYRAVGLFYSLLGALVWLRYIFFKPVKAKS